MVVFTHLIIFSPAEAVWAKGAILSDSWFILLSQAFLTPIINYINAPYCLKKFRQNSLRKKIQNGTCKDKMQEETQILFEKHEFDPSFAYAQMASTVFTAFFFQPLLPLGSASALLGLVLNYYAYKKMLLKDSKKPVMVSDDIAEVTLYLLSCAPFVYGVISTYQLSSTIFDRMLRSKVEGTSTAMLVLGIIGIIYPFYLLFLNTFKDCCNKQGQTQEQNYTIDYDDFRIRFSNEFDRANPITKDDALIDYFNFMKSSLLMI